MWIQSLVVAILLPNFISCVFECPRSDGYFDNTESCDSYFFCVYGNPISMSCPGGLLWNSLTKRCDYSQNVRCPVVEDDQTRGFNEVGYLETKRNEGRGPQPEITLVPNGTFIYMTFDDGPNEGTPYVLDALKKVGVKATFFINSHYLHDGSPQFVERNKEIILRIVNEGHVIGDHSYDHMAHNTIPRWTHNNAYIGVNSDIKWFGQKNIEPVVDALEEADVDKTDIDFVKNTMSNNIRLPFTDNWRAGHVSNDCVPCTLPTSSGENGVELAKALHEEGSNVFGWDVEWSDGVGGEEMFSRLDPRAGKSAGKIVVLSHDRNHISAGLELVKFLSLAVSQGYQFRTVDTYLTEWSMEWNEVI